MFCPWQTETEVPSMCALILKASTRPHSFHAGLDSRGSASLPGTGIDIGVPHLMPYVGSYSSTQRNFTVHGSSNASFSAIVLFPWKEPCLWGIPVGFNLPFLTLFLKFKLLFTGSQILSLKRTKGASEGWDSILLSHKKYIVSFRLQLLPLFF